MEKINSGIKKLKGLKKGLESAKDLTKVKKLQDQFNQTEADLKSEIGDLISDNRSDINEAKTETEKKEIQKRIDGLNARLEEIETFKKPVSPEKTTKKQTTSESPPNKGPKLSKITAKSKTGGRYRRQGLIFLPAGEEYKVTKETLFILRNDPWIEVEAKS